MMYSALFLAATAAVASAQVTYDPVSGTFICPADRPNGAFCAGDSLSTNIIIRCTNGVGQPGNCNDNLAGYFPFGVQSSPCWQSSPTSGIAACSKNCVVQGGSGTYNGTFTLPNCTPISQSSSSSSAAGTTTSTYVQPSITPDPTTTQTYVQPSLNGTTTVTETITTTTTCVTDGTTTTSTRTYTTTYCPPPTYAPSTLATLTPTFVKPSGNITYTFVQPSGTVTSTFVQPSGTGNGNGTIPTEGSHTSATATPVGPSASATTSPVLINGAMANSGSAGAGLVAMCIFFAYFL